MCVALGQDTTGLMVQVVNAQRLPLAQANVELLTTDSSLVKTAATDSAGHVRFSGLTLPAYLLRTSLIGYVPVLLNVKTGGTQQQVTLRTASGLMDDVQVSARRMLVSFRPDKTVINLEGGLTTAGSTILETLEKLPGVTIDKDGNISLKGRPGVTILLDGKPSYLNGSELTNVLSSMSAAQVSQVEIMDNPPAKYDAAGNAGIINIQFKKSRQRGFNGSLSTAIGQGRYFRNSNSVVLNYRTGKANFFLTENQNTGNYFSKAYALRTYYKSDGSVASLLEQDMFLPGKNTSNNLRTGVDYTLNSASSLGLTVYGVWLNRDSRGTNPAVWMQANRQVDSTILTTSTGHTSWQNAGANLNFRHSFRNTAELSADVDVLGYRIHGSQYTENNAGYPVPYSEAYRSKLPTNIHILSAKADYSRKLKKVTLETGWKSSRITTDNLTEYDYRNGSSWQPDLGKSNHFEYRETIHALYGTAQAQVQRWSLQGGLRYESTSYEAKQLGNAIVKDSAFSRRYNSAFPSLAVSFEADSLHAFSLSAGRRIDRPAFQKLNPFITIYNKYSYQQGNPYYRPQYTWNFSLNHAYKNRLITGLQYSVTTDYFSQLFVIDSNGLVLFTEGNLHRMQNLGASMALQLAPVKAWSFSLQAVANRKLMEGVVGQPLTATITQYSVNWSNQFRWQKAWSAELSGTYNSRGQKDIQEVLDPNGLLSAGVSRSVLQSKGTLRFSVRDAFYTNKIRGKTQFANANELFRIQSDSQYAVLSFSWRFGQAYKTVKRSQGSAGDEMQRVGN